MRTNNDDDIRRHNDEWKDSRKDMNQNNNDVLKMRPRSSSVDVRMLKNASKSSPLTDEAGKEKRRRSVSNMIRKKKRLSDIVLPENDPFKRPVTKKDDDEEEVDLVYLLKEIHANTTETRDLCIYLVKEQYKSKKAAKVKQQAATVPQASSSCWPKSSNNAFNRVPSEEEEAVHEYYDDNHCINTWFCTIS